MKHKDLRPGDLWIFDDGSACFMVVSIELIDDETGCDITMFSMWERCPHSEQIFKKSPTNSDSKINEFICIFRDGMKLHPPVRTEQQ